MHELTNDNITSFLEWIQQQNEFKEYNTLLILKFKERDIDIRTIHSALLNLKDLSFIRNSNNAIVVYLINDIGTDLLSNIADSINQMIKKEHGGNNINPEYDIPNFENVYSPVLIIGKNNIFWFGEGEDILLTLNEIYESHSANLNDLKYFKELPDEKKRKVRHYFETDLIVSIDSNNNIRINFNFSNIQSLFPEEINRNINSQKSYQSPICSPKLNVVEEWYDINNIFKRKESKSKEVDLSHFYAFGLYLKFREKYPEYVVSPKITHILIDHSQQDELAKEFAKLLGIDNANIVNIQEDVVNIIPRRTQLFDPKDDVIIITTIISSSETIRRLVKFAKRDLANPMIILCLIDKRKDVKSIETWGTLTEILSIHIKNNDVENTNAEDDGFSINKYSELLIQINKCQTYIAPNYEKEENAQNYNIEENLKTHFIEKKAVHYNHIGNVNSRHFTFYLDKQKILETYSFIWAEFVAKIDSWINENHIDKFTLVIPQYIKENINIWTGCVDYVQKEMGNKISFINWNVDKPNLIKENDNFVFLDFGALTGNTINRFIENLEFPKKILIAILFSQFQDNGHKFYTKVKSLDYSKTIRTGGQINLFNDYKEEIKRIPLEAKIKIEFLYNLPIDVYNSSTCPICEHDRMLEHYKMNTKYMIDFCEDRKKRLKIKSRKTTNGHLPCDFYYTEDDNKYTELSSVLIIKMFELKLLLNYAKSNTHNRKEILIKLVGIATNIKKEILDPDSDLYAFLFLVSHEVLWLQKEPLVFREIRKIITYIALDVAIKDIIELMNGFENFVDDEKQREKIAVRYKYAAITVLRSANKSIFCKNISEIIKNSKKNDGELSNNLVQNTFYHIHSLQINRYNKSGKYFKDLNEQFELLRNESLFTNEQLSTFDVVKIKNNTILQLFGEDDKPLSFISCKEQFTYFRDIFIKLYTSKGHPMFYSSFLALDFRKLDGREDVKKNFTTSEYYSFFDNKISRARNNWNFVKEMLLPIVTNLPNNVFRSTYFEESIFFSTSYRDKIDTFSKTINELTVDKILNEDFYQSYHHLYDNLYNNLIKYRKAEDMNSEDSMLKIFLQDIPSNLLKSVQEIFNDKDFMACKTERIDENLNVFYPNSVLNFFLGQILDNIREKKNEGISLNDITIIFEAKKESKDDKNFVELKIINTGTGQYPSDDNPKGALFQFEEDLKHFDGKLNYETDKENDTFTLTIKFLDYE